MLRATYGLACLTSLFWLSAGEPARADARHLTICPFASPDEFGVVPEPETASDDEDEDDDDDDDEPEDEPGGLSVGGGRCLFPKLEIVVGNQSNLALASLSIGSLKAASVNGQLGVTFGLTHVDRSPGDPIVTTLSMRGDGDGNFSVDQASVNTSSFAIGMQASRFDAWAGDEFTFRSLAPSQSPGQVSGVVWRGAQSIALISVEDPAFRRITVSGYAGLRWPDLVGRFGGKWGDATLTLSAATHETPLSTGDTIRGHAGLASLKYDLPALGDGSYVLAQTTYSARALGYLGINTTSNLLGVSLPGFLSAETAERGAGFSAALVGVWAPSERWQFAAYATAARLTLPGALGGSVSIVRSAMNAKWSPVKNLDFVVEAGYARLRSKILLLPDADVLSVALTLTRSM